MGCVVSDLHTAKLSLPKANIQGTISQAGLSISLNEAKDFGTSKKNITSSRSNHTTADTGPSKGQAPATCQHQSRFSKVLNSCPESPPTVTRDSKNLGSEFSLPEEQFRSERNLAEHSIKSSFRQETPPKIKKFQKNHNPQKRNFRIKKHLQKQAPKLVSPSRDHTSIESSSIERQSKSGYSPSEFSISLQVNMIPVAQVKNIKSETNFKRAQLADMSVDDRDFGRKTLRRWLSCSDNFAPSGHLSSDETPKLLQLQTADAKRARRFACFKIGSGPGTKFSDG
jgi:hypothetical protein